MKKLFVAISVICALTLMAGQGMADHILLVAANATAQVDVAPLGSAKFLDLSPAAGLQNLLAFATVAPNTRIRIIFNAECSVAGGPTNWVGITIRVDPAGATGTLVCPPSSVDKALCAGNHTNALDGWVSATSQCSMVIAPAGVHAVSVVADGVGVAGVPAGWRIDDISLVIEENND